MERRTFFGGILAGMAGLAFWRKADAADAVEIASAKSSLDELTDICKKKNKGYVIIAPHLSSFRFIDCETKNGFDVSADTQRNFDEPFEIAANPHAKENIRHSFMSILTQKVHNDVAAANLALAKLGEKPIKVVFSSEEEATAADTVKLLHDLHSHNCRSAQELGRVFRIADGDPIP